MADINMMKKAITDYISNEWDTRGVWNIEINEYGEDNFNVTLRQQERGYDAGDYEFVIEMTFDDVRDATDDPEMEEEDHKTYMWFSALIDVKSCISPQVNLTDTDDLYTFKEDVDYLYTFINREVYSTLPADPMERVYFYGFRD